MAEYIALVRIIQLAIIPFLGFGCIYFGYRLFSQIPVTMTNDGHVKIPKFGEVKLKAGPGIFFAVLGAAIIYFSIDRSINISSTPGGSAEQASKQQLPNEKAPKASSCSTFDYSCQKEQKSNFDFSNMPARNGESFGYRKQ